MDFYLERKYVAVIGLLAIGLAAGGLVLLNQKGAIGRVGANLSRVFGEGQWMEIKPRVANSTGTSEVKTSGKNQTAKAIKPVIQWCAVKGDAGTKGHAATSGNLGSGTVINEVAWMGTAKSYSDEWIELKNVSAEPASLSGWQLQNKNQKIKVAFGESDVLAAGGFYLLERTDDEAVPEIAADKIYTGSLGNSNEALYLFDADCQLQDSVTATAKWPAGDNATKKTMMRLGNLRWQTSAVAGGTPKMENR